MTIPKAVLSSIGIVLALLCSRCEAEVQLDKCRTVLKILLSVCDNDIASCLVVALKKIYILKKLRLHLLYASCKVFVTPGWPMIF